MIDKAKLKEEMLNILRKSEAFSVDDISWLESIIHRDDGQPGVDQIANLVHETDLYMKAKPNLSVWHDFLEQKKLANALHSIKITAYKQRRVLVFCAQRKKHPKWDIPNLSGMVAPQKIRVDISACYGLDYEGARNRAVEEALSNPAITHLFFVDDDILLPLNAIERLIDYNLPIVSGVYCKKNPTLESVVSYIAEDEQYVFGNQMLKPDLNDLTPVKVGCVGLGMAMVETQVFKRYPDLRKFQFIHETNPDGTKGRCLIGEDSLFVQRAAQLGIPTFAVPGIVGVHVDFKTGNYYAPPEIVDPVTRVLRKHWEEHYTKMACDPKELAAADVVDVFGMAKNVVR